MQVLHWASQQYRPCTTTFSYLECPQSDSVYETLTTKKKNQSCRIAKEIIPASSTINFHSTMGFQLYRNAVYFLKRRISRSSSENGLRSPLLSFNWLPSRACALHNTNRPDKAWIWRKQNNTIIYNIVRKWKNYMRTTQFVLLNQYSPVGFMCCRSIMFCRP